MGRYLTKPFQLGYGGLILELLVYVSWLTRCTPYYKIATLMVLTESWINNRLVFKS